MKEEKLIKLLFDELGNKLKRFRKPLLPDWYDIQTELYKKEGMYFEEMDALDIKDATERDRLFRDARVDFALDAAHKIRNEILDWLGLTHEDVIMAFARDLGAAGGHTVMEDWHTILIDSKYARDNDLNAIGAILAHEIMHIYLHKNNIELPKKEDNEKLTDLASIYTGLGIIVLNGMQDWISYQQTFGYLGFGGDAYGKYFFEYLNKNQIPLGQVAGYILPRSRVFIPFGETVEITGKKSKYVKLDEGAGIGAMVSWAEEQAKSWGKKSLSELDDSNIYVRDEIIDQITKIVREELKKNRTANEEELLREIKSRGISTNNKLIKGAIKQAKARDRIIKKYTKELLADTKIKYSVDNLRGSFTDSLFTSLGLRKKEAEATEDLVRKFASQKWDDDDDVKKVFKPGEFADSLMDELKLPYEK